MEKNSNNQNNNLLEWRMEQVEENLKEVKTDVKSIKESLTKLTALIGNTNFAVQEQKIAELEKENQDLRRRDEELSKKVDGISKKIVAWAAICSVILFLMSQLIIPYILNNYKITNSANARENITSIVSTNTPSHK